MEANTEPGYGTWNKDSDNSFMYRDITNHGLEVREHGGKYPNHFPLLIAPPHIPILEPSGILGSRKDFC
jgi:hypothetical protein